MVGRDFNYRAGSSNLTYGDIVALGGDFYANWSYTGDCPEQISDKWYSNKTASVEQFLSDAKALATDAGGYLRCILSTMRSQENEVQTGIRNGEDPAQVG